jgi:hypothetical protein
VSNQVFVNGLGTVDSDALNGWVQTVATVDVLRGFTGLNDMAVALLGAATPGDAGAGLFYYNENSTAADDGMNVIVPNGNTTGAWIRTGFPTTGPKYFATTPTTYAGLPLSPTLGMIATITDATTTVQGAVTTGGGAAVALIWYDGAGNWRVVVHR